MRVIYLVIVLLFSFPALSQIVEISSTVAAEVEVEVCNQTATSEIKIENLLGQELSQVKILVSLPTGVNYVSSSVNESTSYSVQESDVTQDDALLFSAANLPHGDSLVFEFSYTVSMDAIAFQNAGNVFRNNVTLLSDEDTTLNQGPAYNILYPVFSILSVSPTSQAILSGTTTERTIQIINGGNGKTDEIKISDLFNDASLSLFSIDIGTILDDTIVLSGSDFAAFGNGDNFFDQYETIQIVETVGGTSCSDQTISSTIKAHWGCDSQISTVSSYAHVTLDFQSPSLKLIASEDLNSCFDTGVASVQELIIVNTGSGLADEVVLDLFKSSGSSYDQTIFSRFDPNSFSLKTTESAAYSSYGDYTAVETSNSGDLACLGSNPIGQMIVNLPDLLPGDSLFLTWDMYSCCIQTCENDKLKGWRAEADYTDVCSITSYSKSINGQGVNSQELSFFTETPVEIYDGLAADFFFIVSSYDNDLPQGDGAHYKMTFDLDEGLVYEDLEFYSNSTEWSAFYSDYNTGSNQVVAKFLSPAPFTVPKSELVLALSGDCGLSAWKDISLNVVYVPDTTCSACEIPLECDLTVSTFLNCPVDPCDALSVLSFDVNRTSLGNPDTNLDGVADNSGTADPNLIKLNRAMVGDTIEAIAVAVVGSTSDSWQYAAFSSDIDYGSVLQSLTANIEIYDASTATTYNVSGLTVSASSSGNSAEFYYDLSIQNLTTYNPAISIYLYEQDDSITINMPYKVVSSVSGLLRETTYINEFYLSHFANPTSSEKDYCDYKHGRSTLIGYSWRNNSANNFTVNSCSKVANQNFGMAIGDGGSNYAGGNLFPYEYRDWGSLKEAWMIIPPNYTHVNTSFRQTRTKATNTNKNENITISPDAINGDTLYFDIEQYYGVGLNYSDDGFNGRFQVELAPSCDVPQNTYEDIIWIFNYSKSDDLDGGESGQISASSPDKIKYAPSSLELSSSNPWVDALQRNVTWNYMVNNNSSSNADYAWVHIDAPDNFQIDSITASDGSPLVQQNDLFLIGGINANATANLSIHGVFSTCDTVLMDVYSGFECTGYPTDFSSFECGYQHLVLYVEPKPAAYQPRISTVLMPDPCSPQVEITVDISSVKMAHMYDMNISMTSGDTSKIKVVSSTSDFQYNMSNSYVAISDPTLTGSTFSYDVNLYESSFPLEGIPGVLDLANNQYKLKAILELGSQFKQGDFLQIQIEGANACDVSLPTINLAYDPNSKFKKDQTAGLHLDIGESWSASWGDYDNDGYDDLFVPVKTLNDANILYHNNGDGTFTKVTSGNIVTDIGASVSGTWGDYDNDGFLDLFVANNENSANKLYHNNGDGTFTSVENNPIVDKGLYSHSAAWADYNKDGNLDIVVSDFHATNFNFLFKGDGLGGFEVDETSEVSMSATSAVGVAWGDYDNDGDLDLFIANTNGENNQLYENLNGELKAVITGVIVSDEGHSVGGTWGDYDNDGDLDLYVTNSRDVEPNFLYENNGGGSFTKITSNEVVNYMSNSHGASWIDFDNDGDLDLLVANDQDQQNFLFSNNGDGTFEKLVNAITQDLNSSYGSAWSDYDNDGDYDLFVANIGSNANDFFINEKGSCTNHIIVKLDGCNSNKFGVGAMVSVKATIDGQAKWQTKHVSTQTSAMGGQNSSKLLFGLLDAMGVDSVVVDWPSGVVSTIISPTINQLLTVTESCGSLLCGTIFFDENENSVQDSGEPGIPNQKVLVSPGDFQVYTNSDGEFELFVNDGSYTLSQEVSSNWVQFVPVSSHSIIVNQLVSTEYCGNDFGNTSSCTYPDLEITLGTTAFRKGLTNELQVLVKNSGAYATTENVQFTLEFTDNVYMVDGLWSSVVESGGTRTYTYEVGSLDRLSDSIFILTDSVANNALIDEFVSVSGELIYTGDECSLLNNTIQLTEVVVGSIDPNDKSVFVENKGVCSTVSMDENLLYKIRFQNVGNYAARRAFIKDGLSDHLDWETFEFVSSSHPFDYYLKNGTLCFLNENIDLPDSTSNPEGSQGYIIFKIGIKEDTKPFQKIDNMAEIQFDYNEFIATNMASIITVPEGYYEKLSAFAYPNPTRDRTVVMLIDDNQEKMFIKKIVLSDMRGMVLDEVSVDSDEVEIDFMDKEDGVYFIQVYDEDDNKLTTKVIRH